jgi:hypothetical protein
LRLLRLRGLLRARRHTVQHADEDHRTERNTNADLPLKPVYKGHADSP